MLPNLLYAKWLVQANPDDSILNLSAWFRSRGGTDLSHESELEVFFYDWMRLLEVQQPMLPAMWEIWVRSLGWEDPLEEGMATHCSILAWRIPMARGAWWATVLGVAKSQTRLSDEAEHSTARQPMCCQPEQSRAQASRWTLQGHWHAREWVCLLCKLDCIDVSFVNNSQMSPNKLSKIWLTMLRVFLLLRSINTLLYPGEFRFMHEMLVSALAQHYAFSFNQLCHSFFFIYFY